MPGKRPNIVFLFTDDQRFDTLHALGNPDIHTPNLDLLMRQGTIFRHASIMGGTCGAVCMPSRAMVMTGRSLFRLDDLGQTIPEHHSLLPAWLRDHAGYYSYGIGKWHNSPESYHRAFDGGAQIFFGGMSDHWNVPCHNFDPTGAYVETDVDTAPGHHSTERFSDAAIDFLEQYSDDAPFFLYVAFMAPHDPRTMPKQFLDLYDPGTLTITDNLYPCHPFDNGELQVRDELLAAFPREESEIRGHLAAYYAMISHLDHHIERIIDTLKQQGQYENTIIVLAGDNGLAVGQHGLMGKQNLYEHSVRVPLLFCGPGIPADVQSDANGYLFDLFPTLCDLVHCGKPGNIDGHSLAPALQNPQEKVRDGLYYAYRDVQRAVCEEGFKLIAYVVEGKRRFSLFNLAEDPQETHDLSEDAAYADKMTQLNNRLLFWRTEYEDTRERESAFWQGYFANETEMG